MSFLTILVALIINHYWQRERHLQVDSWFDAWLRWLLQSQNRMPVALRDWRATVPLLAVLLPLVPLAGLLWLAQGVLFGLLTLGIHVIAVVYCFSRVNQQALIEQYLSLWRAGDYEAAYLHVEQTVPEVFDASLQDYGLMHRQFTRYIQLSAFRQLFAVLVFYALIGPIGALAYWLLLALHRRADALDTHEQAGFVDRLLAVAEWVPARLLALAYALAGDFAATFKEIKRGGLGELQATANIDMLEACSAAGAGVTELAADTTDFSQRAALSLEALRDLLLRTQVVWIMGLALAVLVV
jgi:AmpE protein